MQAILFLCVVGVVALALAVDVVVLIKWSAISYRERNTVPPVGNR